MYLVTFHHCNSCDEELKAEMEALDILERLCSYKATGCTTLISLHLGGNQTEYIIYFLPKFLVKLTET